MPLNRSREPFSSPDWVFELKNEAFAPWWSTLGLDDLRDTIDNFEFEQALVKLKEISSFASGTDNS